MAEGKKVRVILLTDGDRVAGRVAQRVAGELGLRCISASVGNPTPLSGKDLVRLVKQARHDPVLVLFDDRGKGGCGKGEAALSYLARHPDISVLGAVAVASNTAGVRGIKPDYSITRSGGHTYEAVDKCGNPAPQVKGVIKGDTVDVLNRLDIPIIIGIGDMGKMDDADQVERGAPVTKKAIQEILAHSSQA